MVGSQLDCHIFDPLLSTSVNIPQMPLVVSDTSNLPITITIVIDLTGRKNSMQVQPRYPCNTANGMRAIACWVPVYDAHCIFSGPLHHGSSHQMAAGTAPSNGTKARLSSHSPTLGLRTC